MVHTAQSYGTTAKSDAITCPKCCGQLRSNYSDQEPECWVCGYVDYSFVPKTKVSKSLISTGTRFLVRYVGHFPAMRGRLVHIRAVRGSGVAKIGHDATCPFCGKIMEAAALSIKRKHMSEDRFICSQGHRISLLQTQDGDIGWK